MKKLQAGFTLIELMIVVAIIGILAAIAIPAYQNYIVRSKVTEAIVNLDAAKTSVADFVASADNNALPTASQLPIATPGNARYISALTWTGTKITATLANLNTQLNGTTLSLIPSVPNTSDPASLLWTCSTSAAATAYSFLPSNCRSQG